ncbi:GYD domain-containing protein [soil metagenome]
MAWFMIQAAYTPEAWAAQIQNPRNRLEDLQRMVEPLGTTVHHGWYSFGEYDIVLIAEADGNVDAVAAVLAAAAGGAVKALRTTPLLTVDEGIDAMQKASLVSYAPPPAG